MDLQSQVGKTTLALTLANTWPAACTYLDLERPADRLRLDDADAYLHSQGTKLVILDEIHRMPGLFEVLRGIIDERRRAGQRTHWNDPMRIWTRCGCGVAFPTMGRLWTMLAHQQGALLQQTRLASGLGVSSPAVDRYIDLLVDLQLVRRLRPWSGHVGKRLVKAPKVYVRDSGLVHALLGIGSLHDLSGHPVCGPSYEGFCMENLVTAAGPQCTPYSYRTHAGAEIDLVLERAGQPWMAIEIKRSTAPTVSKGFDIACDDLKIEQRFVVYPGSERYPMRHGAQAIGLVELMQTLHAVQ